MSPIRVAFAGASGTGKSTLADHVSRCCGVPVNPVGSRSVAAEMGFASPYDVDRAGKRREFQRRLLCAKAEWEASREAFVTDRTPLDNLLYTMLHDIGAVDEETISLVRAGLSRYTHVFFCPVGAFIRTDGDVARVSAPAYHEVYDAAILGLLTRYCRAFVVLGDGDIDWRRATVGRWLDAR